MGISFRTLAVLVLLQSSLAFAAERPRLGVELVETGPSLASSFLLSGPLIDSIVYRTGPVGNQDLYRFDGSSTSLVTNPYADLSFSLSVQGVLNNELYFRGVNSGTPGLYKTDGSSIQLVSNIDPQSHLSFLSRLVTVGQHLYARAQGTNGTELFRTDGAITTEFDLLPGVDSSNPGNARLFGDELLFTANDGIESSRALYRTTSGVPERLGVFGSSSDYDSAREFDGHLYWASDSTLYDYDGNTVSTALNIPGVEDLRLSYTGDNFFAFNGRGPTGWAVYTWDGMTVREFDLDPSPGGNGYGFLQVPFGDNAYFVSSADGNEGFFRTDGTQVVEILGSPGNSHLLPQISEEVVLNDQLIFRSSGPAGSELYRLGNGDVAELIADINPSGSAFFLTEDSPVEFQGELYFRAIGPTGVELYKTDGTTASMVLDLTPGPASSGVQGVSALRNLPFLTFGALSLPEPNLFVTDGESAATFASYFPASSEDGTEGGGIVLLGEETYYIAASGNIYRLSAIPEPTNALMFVLGALLLALKNRLRSSPCSYVGYSL